MMMEKVTCLQLEDTPVHPVSWKNSLFLPCSCNLQHSLQFTERSIPSRDDSIPGEPVHGLGSQSSGIN